MPSVRLLTLNEGSIALEDGINPTFVIPRWRLRAWVRIGTEYFVRQAVIDTGSPLGLMSKAVWEPLHNRGMIEWVVHPPGLQEDRNRMARVAVLNGKYPYRVGRIRVELVELALSISLRPIDVLTQFLEDKPLSHFDSPELPKLLLLGLAHSVFANRELHIAFNAEGNPTSATVSEPTS